MSSLKKLFGTSNKKEVKDTKGASKQLEETRDLIMKKSEFCEKKIEEELAQAKKYGMNNKKMALRSLSRKKAYEAQLTKLDNTLLVIENQLQSLDNAGMNLEVIKSMKFASESLKNVHKNMKVDNIHNVMDEIADQRAVADEISDAISNTAAFGLEYDEDELMQELENLQADVVADELINQPQLPTVPTKDIPMPSSSSREAESRSDNDLRELIEWAQ